MGVTVTRVCAAAALAAALVVPTLAEFDAGVASYQRGDFEAAVREFEPAAEAGAAQFTLGYMHQFGEGVARDLRETARRYRRAAEQGHPAAQYNRGVFHQDGQGAPWDDVAAYIWLDLAARGGARCRESSRTPS